MIEVDPTYFKELKALAATRRRWVQVGSTGFGISTAAAFIEGAANGWPWLLAAVTSLLFTLWSRIDQMSSRFLLRFTWELQFFPSPSMTIN
jgi:hypothetical protein